MKIVIVGAGNLGFDLYLEALKKDHDVSLISQRLKPVSTPENPDILFYTVGGNIEMSLTELWKRNDFNLENVRNRYQPKKTVVFSSNAAEEPYTSCYATIKALLELDALKSQSTQVFRIQNLYGTHKPEECFPAKIRKNPDVTSLPCNAIVPTPTRWLAEKCLHMATSRDDKRINLWPKGETTPRLWAEMILEKHIKSGDFAKNRPSKHYNTDLSITDHWQDLWKLYKQ